MTRLSLKTLSIFGSVLSLGLLSTAMPAAAQYAQCPYGYYYSYGYGCIPDAPAYGVEYGDPYYDENDIGPPGYDSFGLAFGFGGSRGYGRGGGHRGGGGHGGGFGGGHGGGGHGGGGHH